MELIPLGDAVRTPTANFTGEVWMTPAKPASSDPLHLVVATVRFTPGARTSWHSHAHGQALLVTEGSGVLVSRDGTVLPVRQGDTVWTPPGEEHWHGAGTGTLMAHVAILNDEPDGAGTTWLEPVDDAAFQAAQQAGR